VVTKILSGTYSAGYSLAAGYAAVSITGTGVVDGVTSVAYGAVGEVDRRPAGPAVAAGIGLPAPAALAAAQPHWPARDLASGPGSR